MKNGRLVSAKRQLAPLSKQNGLKRPLNKVRSQKNIQGDQTYVTADHSPQLTRTPRYSLAHSCV